VTAGPAGQAMRELRPEIEDFLYLEADLLDTRRFEEWLALFSEDAHYRMPLVRNLAVKQIAGEHLTDPLDVSWFDEGKTTLATRVAQIRTGVHWAEEPLSRTTHFVSNVRVVGTAVTADGTLEANVRSKFLVYRNRNSDEEDKVFGTREDLLRRHGESWLIARRTLYIGQSVLLSNNLSFLI